MNEENEASIPENLQKELPKVDEPKINKRGVLEKLPNDIKNDIDEYLRLHNPSVTQIYIQQKYGDQFPALKTVTKKTVYLYAKKHSLKAMKDVVIETQVTNTPPELLKVIENFADLNISVDDKKAALTSLFNDCAATSKRLESTQTNFVDPHIQMVILQNRKQMCTILEKLAILSDQLSKDSDKNWLEEAEYIIQVCTSAVVNSYKVTHTDQVLFSKFMTDYLSRLTDLMKSYRSTKETLKKEPIKIS
jgi:hypothetical protein